MWRRFQADERTSKADPGLKTSRRLVSLKSDLEKERHRR